MDARNFALIVAGLICAPSAARSTAAWEAQARLILVSNAAHHAVPFAIASSSERGRIVESY
jgi:hypothetical protein